MSTPQICDRFAIGIGRLQGVISPCPRHRIGLTTRVSLTVAVTPSARLYSILIDIERRPSLPGNRRSGVLPPPRRCLQGAAGEAEGTQQKPES
ncbi:hypothetical protein E2C01_040076 [Portunus trituberculatus]|uniref:Uncharacterized protein n=1 Tax=Portunus trituberculatus TaxID=210409 RepID=A0A5B7FLZ9_PORTR|nr:hypothetical protein [Portunus trituberculatus]